jgi:hypothetical protein
MKGFQMNVFVIKHNGRVIEHVTTKGIAMESIRITYSAMKGIKIKDNIDEVVVEQDDNVIARFQVEEVRVWDSPTHL